MGPNHLSNLRLPIVNILAIFIMSNYFLNYLTSHSAGPDRGQAAGGYRDRVFVLECYDGTGDWRDLTHLATAGLEISRKLYRLGNVCHFKLISSSARLEDENSCNKLLIIIILLASLAILYGKRLLVYNYDEVKSLVIFIIGSGEQ